MSATTTAASRTSKTALLITSFPSVPLTTTFTPSASNCGALYSPKRPPIYMIDNEPSCLPPGFSTSNSAFFYSPGIACPSGYWTACHDTTGVSSITTVTCCPTYGDISLSCVPNPLSLSEVWETLFCTWIAPRSTGTVVTVTKSVDGRTSTVTEGVTWPGGINAYGVRMVYESTDLTSRTSSSSGSSSSSSPTSTATGASSSNNNTTTDTTANTGLSTGAKAAIGVVVPLAVLGALLLALLFWRRKRKHHHHPVQQQQSPTSPPFDPNHHPHYQHQQQVQPQPQPQPQPQQYYDHDGGSPPPHYPLTDHPQNKPPGSAGYSYYYSGAPPPHDVPRAWGSASELPSTRAAAELPGEAAPVGR